MRTLNVRIFYNGLKKLFSTYLTSEVTPSFDNFFEIAGFLRAGHICLKASSLVYILREKKLI